MRMLHMCREQRGVCTRTNATHTHTNTLLSSRTSQFNGVLQNTTQEQMYITAAHEVVESCLAGYSGCILAYGQVCAVQ